jgi:hypothetical protein
MAIRKLLGRTGTEISRENFSRLGNISTECDDAQLLSKRVIKSFPSNWLLSVLWFYLYCLLILKMASFQYQCTLNQLLVKTAE